MISIEVVCNLTVTMKMTADEYAKLCDQLNVCIKCKMEEDPKSNLWLIRKLYTSLYQNRTIVI